MSGGGGQIFVAGKDIIDRKSWDEVHFNGYVVFAAYRLRINN